MTEMTDATRIATAAAWADGAYDELCERMTDGHVDDQTLTRVADGLRLIADNLFALSSPFPPPPVRPRFRVVK